LRRLPRLPAAARAGASFKPTRSQRRAWKAHQHARARVLRLCFVPEHYQLYLRYQAGRMPAAAWTTTASTSTRSSCCRAA
jgi:arginine-tRNA-protein transferase